MCRICFSADAVIDVSYGSTDAQGAIGFVGVSFLFYFLDLF